MTLPKKMGLRKRFQLNPRLPRQIGRFLQRVLTRRTAAQSGCHRNRRDQREKARPGMITAVQSFGAGLKTHVHDHILITDGIWFPDWDQASLLGQLRHSILKSLVARGWLQAETANLNESWPLERSGFSAFLGDPIGQPGDRPRLQRVLNDILRPALPLKHLSYVESTGEVRYSPPRAAPKVWEHVYDFQRTLASACRLGAAYPPRAAASGHLRRAFR